MTADPWGLDAFDLPAYLDRLGLGAVEVARPELATLTRVHRAHVAAIPFENLDVPLGRGVRVDLPSIQKKLVAAGRGGYCYEHGRLLGAALSHLRFHVEHRLGRIGDPDVVPRPRSHLVVLVRFPGDERTWLADAGFGTGLLEPVPLVDGHVSRQGGWRFRTVLGGDGGWRLQQHHADGWATLYTLPDEQTFPVDVEGANHVTSTSPTSRFVGQVIAQRMTDDAARALVGHVLTETVPDAPPRTRTVPPAELGEVLASLGLTMTAEEVAVLAALPPRA